MPELRNVNEESVRKNLEGSISSGRTPAEAAGEERWVTSLQLNQQTLSARTRREIIRLVDDWLREKVGADAFVGALLVAEAYAEFLAERVTLAPGTIGPLEIEVAWREWTLKLRDPTP